MKCVSIFSQVPKSCAALAWAQLQSGSRSSFEPTLKEQSAIDDHESSNQETLERPCSTSPPQLFYVLFCERQRAINEAKNDWLTSWSYSCGLTEWFSEKMMMVMISVLHYALLKFWFINSHPSSLFICAQSLHPLVFPACLRHLLNHKWITSPAKQRIGFDLRGFTEEREEIWANSVAIRNLLLHYQPVIHWNASIVLFFTCDDKFSKYGLVHFLKCWFWTG